MVKPVILPIFCVEFLSGQDANPRERDYPELDLASFGVSERLKLAVDGPWRNIVIDKASVTGRVVLRIDISFLMDEGCKVRRPVIWACGHGVPDTCSMI